MKKFIFAITLSFLIYIAGAIADPGIDIVQDELNLTGNPGQTVNSAFTVNNTGDTNLSINFTGFTLINGGTPLTITSLSNITKLENGSSTPATFSVVIPPQQANGTYTGTVTADAGSVLDIIDINLEVSSTFTVSISPSEINLGTVSLNTTHNGEFIITNTGNSDLTNVDFDFSNTDFKFTLNKSDFVLSSGSAETIDFSLAIPDDFSTGNVTLGTISLKSTELNQTLLDVKAEVSGGLVLDDVDVFIKTIKFDHANRRVESASDTSVVDGEKLNFGDKNIGPGTEIRFNFDLENTFTGDEDIDVEDVKIKITIEDIDDGDDIEEESDSFDVKADSSEDIDLFVNIPLSVEAGLYDIIIEVEGEDDMGNVHNARLDIRMDVDKEPRDVIVSNAFLFPETIKCSGTTTLTATIKNIGTKTEDGAGIEIKNNALGIEFLQGGIELDEDPFKDENEFTKKISINIEEGTEAKTYPISVNAYIDEGIVWERKTVNLEVNACPGAVDEEGEVILEEEIEEEEQTETVEVVNDEEEEEIIESMEVPVLEPVTTTEIPLTKRPLFWISVAIINILVIVGLVLLVTKLIIKK